MASSWRETLEEAARWRFRGEFDRARQVVRDFRPATAAEHRVAHLVAWAHEAFWWQAVEGRRCRLRRRSAQDAAFVRSVWADEQFMSSFNRFARPLPAADSDLATLLARECASIITDANSIHWTVETHDGKKAGVLSLLDISLANRRAEILIGVREFPYLGIAAEAVLLAMEFGFSLMGLHKIYSLIYSDNEVSLRNTVHGGFKVEGHLREHVVDPKTKQHVDVVQTGLLRSDLNNPILDKLSRRLLGRRLTTHYRAP